MATSSPSSPLSTTAHWIAAVRARESARPDRLFDDPYAAELAGARGVAMREASERAAGGENAFIPVRTRYFDDALTAAVERGAVAQVVLLGAGMDTRAYRLGLPQRLVLFELDRAEILDEKEGVLAGRGARPRCRRHALPVDLARPWSGPLHAAGFDPGSATAWLAEGLLFYLSDEGVRALLGEAAGLSAAGSLFIADVMGAGVRSLPVMQPYLRWLAANGLPPPFGTDDPAALFAGCGWVPESIHSPGQANVSYGRIPPRAAGASGVALVVARA
jgi:methyltransferase (TIGR00027 family)